MRFEPNLTSSEYSQKQQKGLLSKTTTATESQKQKKKKDNTQTPYKKKAQIDAISEGEGFLKIQSPILDHGS